jgi:hypothetical protein
MMFSLHTLTSLLIAWFVFPVIRFNMTSIFALFWRKDGKLQLTLTYHVKASLTI